MKQHHRMALGYCITILGGICWAIGGACGQLRKSYLEEGEI